MRSQQVDEWEKVLVNLPKNVRVDHPSDKIPISSYWGQAHVWITGWSSTAIEAMAHGVPVITYDYALASFPRSIHFSGSSKTEYKTNLDFLKSFQADTEQIKLLARTWLGFNLDLGTLNLFPPRPDWYSKVLQSRFMSRLNTALYLGIYWIYRPVSVLKALFSGHLDKASRRTLSKILRGEATDLFKARD
jgi:hypothetical protein